MKKKEDIHDYVSAHDAAQILSLKHGRPIRPDYIHKLVRIKKNTIRYVKINDRILYNQEDIANCTVTQKSA